MVLVVQAISAAIRYIRNLDGLGSSDKSSSQPHRDIGALTYSVFQLEHALILSLFAEFVLATKSFNLILFQPFPTITRLMRTVRTMFKNLHLLHTTRGETSSMDERPHRWMGHPHP